MADVRLRRAYIELNARVGKYEAALRTARRDNDRFNTSLKGIRTQIRANNAAFGSGSNAIARFRSAFGGLVAFASVGRLSAIAQEAATYGATLVETATAVELTTEELERFRFVLQSDGVALTQSDKILKNVLKTFSDARNGLSTYRRAYEQLGFTQDDFNNRNIDAIDILKRLNSEIRNLDVASRVQVISDIAGRAGREAITALLREDFAQNLEADIDVTINAQSLKDLDQQLLEVRTDYQALRRNIVALFAPDIIQGLSRLREGLRDIDADEVSNNIRDIVSGLGGFVTVGKDVAGTLNDIRRAIPFDADTLANIALAVGGFRAASRGAKTLSQQKFRGLRRELQGPTKDGQALTSTLVELTPLIANIGLVAAALIRIPSLPAGLVLGLTASFNLLGKIGGQLNGVIPTLEEINALSNTTATTFTEAESRVNFLADAIQTVRRRLENTPRGGHAGRAYRSLENTLESLTDAYRAAIEQARGFRQETQDDPTGTGEAPFRPVEVSLDQLRAKFREVIRELESKPLSLGFSLAETQRLNQAIELGEKLPGIFRDTAASADAANSSADGFINSLRVTSNLTERLSKARLDLRFKNAEVTLDEYETLRARIEAVRALSVAGLPINESTERIVQQYARDYRQLLEVQRQVNAENERANQLVRDTVFITRRFVDGLADVATEFRGIKSLVADLGREFAKTALRATLLRPFSNLLTGILEGGNPLNAVRRSIPNLNRGRDLGIFESLIPTNILPTATVQAAGAGDAYFQINAVDATGVRRIINEEIPKAIELGGQLGLELSIEDRFRQGA